MVRVTKSRIGNQTYYYLEHSFRDKGKVKNKRKYLGKTLPKDVDKMKAELMSEVYRERWHPLLDSIREGYSKESQTMPKSLRDKELKTFSVRFTYDTSRIEGSTLTFRETADLLERGMTPGERPLGDVKEAEAHEKLFYEMLGWDKDISMETILYCNKRLLEGTKPDIAGKIRSHQVAISGSKFTPPSPVELYPLLQDFLGWYRKNKGRLHPVELAALVHLKLVTIHPFGDGNGRVSRLLMNFVLCRHGSPMLNILYEKRDSYYNALERSQTTGDDSIFVQWMFRRYVGTYKRFVG